MSEEKTIVDLLLEWGWKAIVAATAIWSYLEARFALVGRRVSGLSDKAGEMQTAVRLLEGKVVGTEEIRAIIQNEMGKVSRDLDDIKLDLRDIKNRSRNSRSTDT